MNVMDLLKSGAMVWNSQRAKSDMDAQYHQYVDAIEAFNPYGYDPVNFEQYASWYMPIRLRGANLQAMDLRDYDLSWADLEEAKLNGADLRKANLSYCNLASANLTGADMRGANLTGITNLGSAILSGALIEQKSLDAAPGARIFRWHPHNQGGVFTGLDTLSLDTWGAIVQFYQRRCAYCSGPYEIMDHFLPLGQGGITWVGNVVPACFACWGAKGDYRRPNDKVIPPEVLERIASELQERVQLEIEGNA